MNTKTTTLFLSLAMIAGSLCLDSCGNKSAAKTEAPAAATATAGADFSHASYKSIAGTWTVSNSSSHTVKDGVATDDSKKPDNVKHIFAEDGHYLLSSGAMGEMSGTYYINADSVIITFDSSSDTKVAYHIDQFAEHKMVLQNSFESADLKLKKVTTLTLSK